MDDRPGWLGLICGSGSEPHDSEARRRGQGLRIAGLVVFAVLVVGLAYWG